MVRINENLVINESYIISAEFSKVDGDQILTLLFAAGTTDTNGLLYELVLKGAEAWALWEYLTAKADRC
ncbi:MAG: hypothetical protein J2P31_09350 [Blastocatellia bacterium]|nr:hypothetical protein [Blastocatellia bacterium]